MQYLTSFGVRVMTNEYIGKRIELVSMPDDPDPVPAGTLGTCYAVDGLGHLLMNWDNGRTLSLIPGIDTWRIVADKGG